MSKTILITGGAGFIGHHFVEHFLKSSTEDTIFIADSLTYAGSLDRLRNINIDPLNNPRVKTFTWDFRNPAGENLVRELSRVTHVIHMGAETHVDNSITDPMRFVQANVVGTCNVLELARQLSNLELFCYFSTDEVFGPAPMNAEFKGFSEYAVHSPKNPYAATKSAGEQLVTSYQNTYGLPCVITRVMNVFGERQHPEKFIPICIRAAINGDKISIHGTPDRTKAGTRCYIHARNVASAYDKILNAEKSGSSTVNEVFNIVGELEIDNLTLAKTINEYTGILGEMKKVHVAGSSFEIVDFHSSRPGHDLRYALDGSKIRNYLGWVPPKNFYDSLRKTVEWYLDNQNWLQLKKEI